ncbi:MAG: hypothetical protein R3F37_09945 [Candidatus Competibacteraceae bacterium]
MLQIFGSMALIGGVLSLLIGKTYFREVVDRHESPFMYWSNTLGLF